MMKSSQKYHQKLMSGKKKLIIQRFPHVQSPVFWDVEKPPRPLRFVFQADRHPIACSRTAPQAEPGKKRWISMARIIPQ